MPLTFSQSCSESCQGCASGICSLVGAPTGVTLTGPSGCAITIDTDVIGPGDYQFVLRRTDPNTGGLLCDSTVDLTIPAVTGSTVNFYHIDSALKCADCLVDVCGDPLRVNEAGCMVIPRSGMVDNEDGTYTFAYLDGESVETTTINPTTTIINEPLVYSGDRCQILRGDSNGTWVNEDNASFTEIPGFDSFDHSPSIPAALGNRVVGSGGGFDYTNNTGCQVIAEGSASVESILLTAAGAQSYNFDLGNSVVVFVNGVVAYETVLDVLTDGGTQTPTGFFIRTGGRHSSPVVLEPGDTVAWRYTTSLNYSGTNVYTAWAQTSQSYQLKVINHTDDE